MDMASAGSVTFFSCLLQSSELRSARLSDATFSGGEAWPPSLLRLPYVGMCAREIHRNHRETACELEKETEVSTEQRSGLEPPFCGVRSLPSVWYIHMLPLSRPSRAQSGSVCVVRGACVQRKARGRRITALDSVGVPRLQRTWPLCRCGQADARRKTHIPYVPQLYHGPFNLLAPPHTRALAGGCIDRHGWGGRVGLTLNGTPAAARARVRQGLVA